VSKGEATSVMQAGFFFSILRSCRRGVIVQAVYSIFLNMLEDLVQLKFSFHSSTSVSNFFFKAIQRGKRPYCSKVYIYKKRK
jgi:hypothetical protein